MPDTKLYAVSVCRERGGLSNYIGAIPVSRSGSTQAGVLAAQFRAKGMTVAGNSYIRLVEASSIDAAKKAYAAHGPSSGFPANPPRFKRGSRRVFAGVDKTPLSIPDQHRLKIARQTLKYSDVGARIMGGMTKEEARRVIEELTGRRPNEPLHSVRNVGSNMTEVDHGSLYILYSYETPVAVRPREGVGSKPFITSKQWSRTTSKHIGQWLRTHGFEMKDAERVPQDVIDAMASRGYAQKDFPINVDPTPAQMRDAVTRLTRGRKKNAPRRPRLTPRRKALLKDVKFFRAHGGGVVGEATKGALDLARAERKMPSTWNVIWEWDDDADLSWMSDEERAQEHEVWRAVLVDNAYRPGSGSTTSRVLASLGGIVDPSHQYKRVVEAELVAEALAERKRGRA